MSDKPRGERLRLALNEMGPIYVKFGQIISTRRDLVAPDIADELALLQDQVPPFPGAQARDIVESALGKPVASCSVFRLRTAGLGLDRPGARRNPARRQEVVVKVVRPGIRKLIRRDIDLLMAIARLAEKYWETRIKGQADRVCPRVRNVHFR